MPDRVEVKRMRVFFLFVVMCFGCRHDQSAPLGEPVAKPPVEVVTKQAPATNATEPTTPGPVTPSPETLYQQCFERVEGAESDSECTTDEECAAAGCGGEVCTTTTLQPSVVTSCEARPCFQVLDRCGCKEGRCQWSLKTTVPVTPPVQLKIKLEEPG